MKRFNIFSLWLIGIISIPTSIALSKGIDGTLFLLYCILVGMILGLNIEKLLKL